MRVMLRKSMCFKLNRSPSRMMKVKWQDKISNRELLERASIERLRGDVR